MRKLISALLICVIMLALPLAGHASFEENSSYFEATGYDEGVDYMALMRQCAEDGSEYALIVGALYEQQRNLKSGENTDFFSSDDPLTEIMLYTGELQSIGKHWVTGYVPTCSHCCGKSNGITASGEVAEVGDSIAMAGMSFGTKIYIEGLGTFTVEDRGVSPGVIDVTCATHEDCYAITGQYEAYKLM